MEKLLNWSISRERERERGRERIKGAVADAAAARKRAKEGERARRRTTYGTSLQMPPYVGVSESRFAVPFVQSWYNATYNPWYMYNPINGSIVPNSRLRP